MLKSSYNWTVKSPVSSVSAQYWCHKIKCNTFKIQVSWGIMLCQSAWHCIPGDLKVSALHNSSFCHYIAYSFNKHLLFQCLYDLLMNLLEERGISNEFVEKLSDFSTAYEHSLYIALLENTKKFVSGK